MRFSLFVSKALPTQQHTANQYGERGSTKKYTVEEREKSENLTRRRAESYVLDKKTEKTGQIRKRM